MIDKTQIQSNFARHADHYDLYAQVQDRVGQALLEQCPAQGVDTILDIGSGTGTFTRHVRDRYSQARMTAVDLCPNMIEVARTKLGTDHMVYVVGDAETVPLPGPYDLIVSNACMQWFSDLSGALETYGQALTDQGMLVFSMFGPKTFCELSHALSRLMGRPMAISAEGFYHATEVECYLRRVFDTVTVRCAVVEQAYDTVWDLLKAIKYTGTKGSGVGGQDLSRQHIEALDKIYRVTYGQVVASYEVFYCQAFGVKTPEGKKVRS
jgi:malonyl-CoA O-methyltransferase